MRFAWRATHEFESALLRLNLDNSFYAICHSGALSDMTMASRAAHGTSPDTTGDLPDDVDGTAAASAVEEMVRLSTFFLINLANLIIILISSIIYLTFVNIFHDLYVLGLTLFGIIVISQDSDLQSITSKMASPRNQHDQHTILYS